MKYVFRFFQGLDQRHYLTIEHINGQVLYTSEGYERLSDCEDTLHNFITGIRELSGDTGRIVASGMIVGRRNNTKGE